MRTILPLLVVGVLAGSILVSAADNLPAFKPERWVNSAPLTANAPKRRDVRRRETDGCKTR
jgi:hypothetical protein